MRIKEGIVVTRGRDGVDGRGHRRSSAEAWPRWAETLRESMEGAVMAKVGQFVSIPTGSYCNITLDSGEKIIVNHEPGASGAGRLTIERLKLMGFSSQVVVEINLDTAEGKAALAELTKEGPPGIPGAPLGMFVTYVQGCASVAEVVSQCQQLLRGR